jgi:predicted O-methyltransferase YrrM
MQLERGYMYHITKYENFEKAGGLRNIYNALLSILIYLKPKICLEIGTYYGQSADVFAYYFDNYMPDGILVTTDIKLYKQITHPNIVQLLVHPHVTNSQQWHYVSDVELLPCVEYSASANIDRIQKILPKTKFDFCFLDGDHQRSSVYQDFTIAKSLLDEPQYILFDDIDVQEHDSTRVYEEDIKTDISLNIYDFADWNEWVGAALLWNKELL